MYHIYDCIVVGGGISGLVCAHELKKKGKDVLVIESGSVGGRMESIEMHGHKIDLAAGFILDSYKELLKVAKEVGLKPVQSKIEMNIGIVEKHRKIKDASPIHTSLTTKIELVKTALLNLHQLATHDITEYSTLAKQDENLASWLNEQINHEFLDEIINPLSNDLFFYGAEHFSKNLFFGLMRYVIGSNQMNFPNGIGELSKKLAENIPTIENTRIGSIDERADHVELTYGSFPFRKKIKGRKVIVAVQGNKVLNLLSVPTESQKNFFKQIRYSSTIKLFGITKSEEFKSHNRIYFNDHKSLASVNVIKQEENETLISIGLKHEFSKHILDEKWSDNRIIQEVKKLDPSLATVKFIKVQRWASAVPMFTPNHVQNIDSYQNMINTSGIAFCGDYLVAPFVEGAVISGLRAAAKVLG